jgi:hypothetical protein
MRYIAFPQYGAEKLDLRRFCPPSNIVSGPTESGLYLLEIEEAGLPFFEMMLEDCYVLIQDFEEPK